MKKVRFAPSPTGSLHVGNALSAVANRAFGDWMLLRIDDTDPARNVPGGEEAISATSSGSASVGRGPDSPERAAERYREAARAARRRASTASRSSARTARRPTSSRRVVDDIDFGITHIVRGNDHRPNEALHRRLFEALGASRPSSSTTA